MEEAQIAQITVSPTHTTWDHVVIQVRTHEAFVYKIWGDHG